MQVPTEIPSSFTMCFYDQYEYACKDFRWGNFKQHCNKEYRRGETCGMKLVNDVIPKTEVCTICDKIERKTRRYWKAQEKLDKWGAEGRLRELQATVEKTQEEQMDLRREIEKLQGEREDRAKQIGRTTRGAQHAVANHAPAYAGYSAAGGQAAYSNGYAYPNYAQGYPANYGYSA
jgi:hypothetical protein